MKKIILIFIAGIILGGLSFFISKIVPQNTSLSPQEFRIAAEKLGYSVDDYKKLRSEVEDIFHGQKDSLIAIKKSETYTHDMVETYIWYYLFENDDQAYDFFFHLKSFYSSKKFMSPGTHEFQWDNKSKMFGNTQYYNQIGTHDRKATICRVDNTVIFSEYFWSESPKEFFEEIGYKYK
jgi:hypothetical protein